MGNSPAHAPWGWNGPARVLLTLIAAAAAIGLGASARPQRTTSRVPPLVVDPNTAPAAVLVSLPRLGPALAGRIVEARNAEPFHTLDDLDRRVPGIGPSTMTALRPFLHIEPTDESSEHPIEPDTPDESP